MVSIEFEPGEMASLNAAIFHTTHCRTCSHPYTTPVRSRVCLAGLMHYAKTVKVLAAAKERAEKAAADATEATP